MAIQDFFGLDPGLHTSGVVHLVIDTSNREVESKHLAIVGDVDHVQAARWFISEQLHDVARRKRRRIFVEKFRERGNAFSQDEEMRSLMAEISKDLGHPYELIDNTGVKKVVRRPVRAVLGLVGFPSTHHRDLESAANIMLYGMLKDEALNRLLADIVKDCISGDDWRIIK